MSAANKKNRKSLFEIIPSANGRRVEPKISEDLIKRIQAAEKAKTRKEIKKEYDPDDPTGISPSSGEKKPKGRVKKEKVEKPEKADKGEKSDGLKQTKLNFKKEPKKKRMTFSGSSSGEMSDSEVESVPVVPRERQNARRAATKVQKYKDGEESSESVSEVELLDNKVESDKEPPRALSDSEDEDDFNVKKKPEKKPAEMDSDCLFDSLIEDTKKEERQNHNLQPTMVLSSDEDEPPPPPVESPPAKKKAAPKRKLLNTDKEKEQKPKKRPAKVALSLDSDDDSIFDSKKDKKKANPKKKTKKGSSDSESEDFVANSPPPARNNARARPQKKYNFSDGSDSD